MKRASPLRMLYVAKGFTGRGFAREVGCDHSSLMDWETGRVVPHFFFFRRMVEILDDLPGVYAAITAVAPNAKPCGVRRIAGKKRVDVAVKQA